MTRKIEGTHAIQFFEHIFCVLVKGFEHIIPPTDTSGGGTAKCCREEFSLQSRSDQAIHHSNPSASARSSK